MNSTIDQNKKMIAIDWIKKLANGINPLDGSLLPDNDVINNVHISRCLFYVAELLEDTGKNNSSLSKSYEEEFYLSPEDSSKIVISEKTTISEFVREINKVIPNNMKPLSYSSVTKWLMRIGYLDEALKDDGRKTKIPTEQGRRIGISSEQRVGSYGEYTVIIYDANAQRFILDNLFKE